MGLSVLSAQFVEWTTIIVNTGGAMHFSLNDCWLFCCVLVMVTLGQITPKSTE